MAFERVREIFAPKRTLEVLQVVAENGPLRYGEVADAVDTSSDTLSRSLDSLVVYGLLQRNAENQRRVSYELTQLGQDVLQQAERLEDELQSQKDE